MGSHGARPDVVILDELTHQRDKDFASTLLDNADKMPCSLVVVVTNAGFDPSWQLDWKRTFGTQRRWRILEYAGRPPWISKAAIAEAEVRNSPNRFLRLWRGVWTSDTETALSPADVQASVTMESGMDGTEPGWVFVGGLDIGLAKHSTAFVVLGMHVGHLEQLAGPERQVSSTARALIDAGLADEPEPDEPESVHHQGTNRLRLADIRCWKPGPGRRVSLDMVKSAILGAHRKYRLAGLSFDPYQGEHLAEQLEKEGVPMVRTPQTTVSLQEQAVALIESFQQKTIDIFDENALVSDLKRLQLKDTGQKVRLVSPELKAGDSGGTGHGDAASALSLAVALAKGGTNLLFTRRSVDTILAY